MTARRTFRRASAALAVGAAALMSLPLSVAGQTVTGRVVERATGTPVSAALIELLTGDTLQVAATLTGPDGSYSLAPGRAATYTLRVRRLGYATRAFGDLDVVGVRRLDVELDTRPVELEGVVATARAACAAGPGVGPGTQRLWDLVVDALDVARLAQDLGTYRFDMHQYVRDLDLDRTHVRTEGVQRTVESGAFVAMSVGRLEAQGYIEPERDGTLTWYMPLPDVLVSDPFLQSHCFRVVNGPTNDVVGLGFEPTPERMQRRPDVARGAYPDVAGEEIVDVRGVLWVDRTTGALKELEYAYTGLEDAEIADLSGGYARFEQLAGGVWIVRQWLLRMPNLEADGDRLAPSSLREVGGLVVDVRSDGAPGRRSEGLATEAGTSALRTSGSADLTGRLVPGAVDMGAGGAVVRLSGSPWAVRTDAEGRFSFRGVPPGPYLVTAWTPRLDSLGLPTRSVGVVLEAGQDEAIVLPGPGVRRATELLCETTEVDPSLGIVRVHAHDEDGDPVPDRRIRLWTLDGDEFDRVSVSSPHGVTTFCGVPTRAALAVTPVGDPTRAAQIWLDPSEIRLVRLRVR